MKWLWISIGVVVVAMIFFGFRMSSSNASFMEDLRTNPQGANAQRAMILVFPDGRELPVNYIWEGEQVFTGADGPWWREFREGDVPVQMLIKGEMLSGRAYTVLDDDDYTRDVFTRLRPNVPKWLPFWLDAYLVVIDLDG